MIVSCKCRHDYQDKKYGKGKRVANQTLRSLTDGKNPLPKDRAFRCTVCGTLQKGE